MLAIETAISEAGGPVDTTENILFPDLRESLEDHAVRETKSYVYITKIIHTKNQKRRLRPPLFKSQYLEPTSNSNELRLYRQTGDQ